MEYDGVKYEVLHIFSLYVSLKLKYVFLWTSQDVWVALKYILI